MREQPNILVLMTDEHAPQASEVYGHPYVKTPNLKKLSESGVVFDQAYSDCPLCAPVRASFVTAQKVHNHQVWDNGAPLSSELPTFAHVLSTENYETVLSGKMHFVGPDQLHGFEKRLTVDCQDLSIFGPDPNRTGTGKPTPNSSFDRRLPDAGPSLDHPINDYDDEVESQAISYLRDYETGGQERPFALVTSFCAPHFPLNPRPEYYDLYKDIVEPPSQPPADSNWEHPVYKRLRNFFEVADTDDETVLRARAAYYGLITQTDNRIGNILDQLSRLDLSRPTVIIYVADHGEMMGEKGLWWKNNMLEEAVRIPLIVSCTDPNIFPAHRESMPVTLIDVARTIMGLSQAKFDESWFDGMDLTPYLEGKSGNKERVITSEYHAHGTASSMGMVRKGKYKLIYFEGESCQLFDLEKDPNEWYDISDAPEMEKVIKELLPYATEGWPENLDNLIRNSLQKRQLIANSDVKKVIPNANSDWVSVGGD